MKRQAELAKQQALFIAHPEKNNRMSVPDVISKLTSHYINTNRKLAFMCIHINGATPENVS